MGAKNDLVIAGGILVILSVVGCAIPVFTTRKTTNREPV